MKNLKRHNWVFCWSNGRKKRLPLLQVQKRASIKYSKLTRRVNFWTNRLFVMSKSKVVIPIQILAQYFQPRLKKEPHMRTQAVYFLPKLSMIWLTHKQSESKASLLLQMGQLSSRKDLRYEMLRDIVKANQSSSESKLIPSLQIY